MLRDETIKRFFFQSSAMLSTLFHWIDQFRSHVSVTLQKLNGKNEGLSCSPHFLAYSIALNHYFTPRLT